MPLRPPVSINEGMRHIDLVDEVRSLSRKNGSVPAHMELAALKRIKLFIHLVGYELRSRKARGTAPGCVASLLTSPLVDVLKHMAVHRAKTRISERCAVAREPLFHALTYDHAFSEFELSSILNAEFVAVDIRPGPDDLLVFRLFSGAAPERPRDSAARS